MAAKKPETPKSTESSGSKKDRAAGIANTFEWLVTAFILAFVFRAFAVEAFRIPTGSMADTLCGAHFRLRCQECGFEYNHGFTPDRGSPSDYVPLQRTQVSAVACPSCGYTARNQVGSPLRLLVANGDRILVLKCLYQFTDPKRWDVIVFKNPTEPKQNYIKRLVGLPGETLEIVDGDLFVDGHIARKPPMVQEELWIPLYDHDYQPLHPERPIFYPDAPNYLQGHSWIPPLKTENSLWEIKSDSPTQFTLDAPLDQVQNLPFQPQSAAKFNAAYSYNSIAFQRHMPVASDLMGRFHATPASQNGFVGLNLSKYGIQYAGRIHANGRLSIERGDPNGSVVLAETQGPPLKRDHPSAIRFGLVDQRLILECDSERLVFDLDDSLAIRKQQKRQPPAIAIQGTGQWSLAHIALYRDTHYLSKSPNQVVQRATEGHPFTLNQDEFFVLGDNSPNSQDARWWDRPEIASRGYAPPRAGIVPRNYLMGKAMFVYWPSGFEFPWPRSVHNWIDGGKNSQLKTLVRFIVRLRWIPNVGRMRYIYGGSASQYRESS